MDEQGVAAIVSLLTDAGTIAVLIWCLYKERERVDYLLSAVAEERRRLWAYILVLRGGTEGLTDRDMAGLAEIMTKETPTKD